MQQSVHDIASGQFDYIVVGGGSAGCVLASRLSEDPKVRVLLIEAGQDFAPGHEPAVIREPGSRTFTAFQYYWPLTAEGVVPGMNSPFGQARVMGGGGSVNGMHAQRGEADDYDEWRQLGVVGWGWDDLLPFFRKVETDLDFSGPLHGDSGPIKIKRFGPEYQSALSAAFLAAFRGGGIREVPDINVESGEGVAVIPLSVTSQRMSSAMTYLTPEVRARANLAILADTTVRRVTFSGKSVSGVELDGPGSRIIRGANVVSCAGAIQSPVLLQRSGIGPGDVLSAAGIDVIAERQGVGRNLQNHPFLDITTHLHRRARARSALYPPSMVTARFASQCPGAPPADLVLNLFERVSLTLARDPLARHFANFMLLLNKAYSEGTVAIDPAHPFGGIKVKTNILGDVRDRDRMIAGFRRVALLTQSGHFKGLVSEAFVLKPHWAMMTLMQGTWRSQVISDLGALALESPGAIRRFMLRNAVAPIQTLLNNATALENHVMSNTQIGGHPAGTCQLGDAARDTTVVDSRCRVVGVDGLRVVDASIFPTLMRAGPNLPVMTAAEKVATMIQEDARGS